MPSTYSQAGNSWFHCIDCVESGVHCQTSTFAVRSNGDPGRLWPVRHPVSRHSALSADSRSRTNVSVELVQQMHVLRSSRSDSSRATVP